MHHKVLILLLLEFEVDDKNTFSTIGSCYFKLPVVVPRDCFAILGDIAKYG